MKQNNSEIEKIFIIQPIETNEYQSIHEEAISLIESSGACYAGTIYQSIREVNPATYIGQGKLLEIQQRLEGLDISVLFNGELTPSQTLNISAVLGNRKVIDRTTLILDIFAKNAVTNEGKLQVELAQLKYLYPRLKGKGEALSRLGGGIGTRGPGETKLETDRRRIRVRIKFLEERLKTLENKRQLLIRRREKENINRISLIGYTNTGKSTLLNLLTGADVYAKDQLFATLDPTSRKLTIDNSEFILTDTVGFLRNLPHNLISAFHSTLESALSCDLLLIVCDYTNHEMQLKTTLDTLQELNCDVPYKIVLNKCENIKKFDDLPPDYICISAKYNLGIENLKSEILKFFSDRYKTFVLSIPYTRINEYNRLKNYLTELDFQYSDSSVQIKARIPNIFLDKFKNFMK